MRVRISDSLPTQLQQPGFHTHRVEQLQILSPGLGLSGSPQESCVPHLLCPRLLCQEPLPLPILQGLPWGRLLHSWLSKGWRLSGISLAPNMLQSQQMEVRGVMSHQGAPALVSLAPVRMHQILLSARSSGDIGTFFWQDLASVAVPALPAGMCLCPATWVGDALLQNWWPAGPYR